MKRNEELERGKDGVVRIYTYQALVYDVWENFVELITFVILFNVYVHLIKMETKMYMLDCFHCRGSKDGDICVVEVRKSKSAIGARGYTWVQPLHR